MGFDLDDVFVVLWVVYRIGIESVLGAFKVGGCPESQVAAGGDLEKGFVGAAGDRETGDAVAGIRVRTPVPGPRTGRSLPP